jgi:peptide/nickel transport system permease protein
MRWLLERVGQYILVLWVALTLNFFLPRIAPGDPVRYLVGNQAEITPEQRAQILSQYGLDRPLIEQYGLYWSGILQGDLGHSVRFGGPVAEILMERLPWTLLLVGSATVLSALIGILAGTVAAWKRGSVRDTGLMVTVLSLEAMPGFWIGMILISIFAVSLGWFPSFGAVSVAGSGGGLGFVLEVIHHMVLPVLTITLATTGSLFLLSRASLLTTLGEDYTLMAEAKGVSERGVIFRHALRNALLPVYTNLTLSLGTLVSGAVVVETVFAYPGLGRLIYEGVLARDYPLLQGAFLLVTVGVILANLLADLTYPLLDPRVRRSGTSE